MTNLNKAVERNHETNEKILKILQGNGDGGLIWKVNSLIMKNQWVDKGVSIGLSVFSTLLTLYLAGLLHI